MKKNIWYHKFKSKLNPIDIQTILFSLCIGVLITFIKGYRFGVGDQIEQVPLIYRQLLPTYLANDFFLNAAAGFGPRYFYTACIAFLAQSVTHVPLTIFVLTLVSNTLVIVIAAETAKKLWNLKYIGLIAAAVVAIGDFDLVTSAAAITGVELVPQQLAMPFLLLAFRFAITHQTIFMAVSIFVASFIHPSLGLGTGGIFFVSELLWLLKKRQLKIDRYFLQKLLLPLIIISLPAFIWMYMMAPESRIEAKEFVHIFGSIRSPHHVLPRTWPLYAYFEFISSVVAFFVITRFLQRKNNLMSPVLTFFQLVSIIIFLGCTGAYFFADSIFVRFWLSVQPFRFLYLVKYMLLLLVSLTIGINLADKKCRPFAYTLIASTISPILLAITLTMTEVKEKACSIGGKKCLYIFLFLHVLLLVLWMRFFILDINYVHQFLIIFAFLIFNLHGKIPHRTVITALCVILFIVIIFVQPSGIFPLKIEKYISYLRPIVQPEDHRDEVGLLAQYIKRTTSTESIFLIPPQMGQLRHLAGRALVVDFKAIPFQEVGMRGWYERISSIYEKGENEDSPEKVADFDKNYENIIDEKILRLKSRYTFSYVILYNQTHTSFPVIFKTRTYKIIKI